MHTLELLPPTRGLHFDEPSHTYSIEHKHLGRIVIPSVSQIMQATGSKCMNYAAWRDSLIRNGKCQTEAEADAFMEAHRSHRAMVGTQVHHLAESHLLDRQPAEVDPEAELMFEQWLTTFYPRIGSVLISEQPMLHRAYMYCGTPDLVAEIDGEYMVVDWKTQVAGREKVRPEWSQQIGAYAELVHRCHDLTLRKAAMVVVTTNGIKVQPYNYADLKQGLARFFGFLAEHHALQARLGSLPHHIALTAMENLFQ
jgi:ATP-dependent exoDNAse (exonuclease V) beta subunit